jgi:hypothetical protein
MGPHMGAYKEVLGADSSMQPRAMLRLVLSFFRWRTLVREWLDQTDAAEAMVQAIDCMIVCKTDVIDEESAFGS